MTNKFDSLDSQDDLSHSAQFTTEEHAEYSAWIDSRECCLDLAHVKNAVVQDIDMHDCPDFCDAYLESADLEAPGQVSRALTEEELDYINEECREFVYDCIIAKLY